MPFDAHDLWRQAGYESGDAVPLESIQGDGVSFSTTNTSFTSFGGRPDRLVVDTSRYPFDNFQISTTGYLGMDTAGETADQQVRELENGVSFSGARVSVTGNTTEAVAGPLTDMNQTGILGFVGEVRSSDGTATATMFGPQIQLWGVLE